MAKVGQPPPQWVDKGGYKEPVDSDNIRVPRLEVDDATTFIDKDVSDNMTFEDAVTGSKTLAELSAGGTDSDAIHDNVANEIATITLKATPAAADEIVLEDSAASYVKKSATVATVGAGIKLDDLATPDDNTDLDFSTTVHGLTPKGTNVGNFLKDDGSWAAPAGGGDVTGPASSTDNEIARQHSTTGKVLQTYTSNPPTISDTGDMDIDGDLNVENIVVSGNVDGRDVSADGALLDAHKDRHDPADGADALDTAAAAEISVVVAAGAGTSHSLARADHIHAINHAITDNHLLTVDGTINSGEYLKATANGAEGKTYAEALADLFSVAMPENSNIEWDNALSADGKWSGIVTKQFNGGATIPFGEVVYLKAADSEWYQAKADVTATSGAVMVGICVLATTDGNACTVLLQGKVRADAKFPALTISAPVFISAATAGLVTPTAPTGTTGFVVRIVGHGGTADELYVHPDNSYVELA